MKQRHRQPPEVFQRFCRGMFQGVHRQISNEDELIGICLDFIRVSEWSVLGQYVDEVLV